MPRWSQTPRWSRQGHPNPPRRPTPLRHRASPGLPTPPRRPTPPGRRPPTGHPASPGHRSSPGGLAQLQRPLQVHFSEIETFKLSVLLLSAISYVHVIWSSLQLSSSPSSTFTYGHLIPVYQRIIHQFRPIISLRKTHKLRGQYSLLLQSISTQLVSPQIQLIYCLVIMLPIMVSYCGNSSQCIKYLQNYRLISYLTHTSISQRTMAKVQILYTQIKHHVQHTSILRPVLWLLYANVFLSEQAINVKIKMP